MATPLAEALNEIAERLSNSSNFVRLVLSGRRRNMQTPNERIDVKPVLIKGEINLAKKAPEIKYLKMSPNFPDE